MAKPKEARNKLFIKDWQEGLSDQSLVKKYGLSIGGVKGLKARLRAKDPSLYTKKKPKPLTKVEKEIAKASGGLVQFASKLASQKAGKQEKKLTAKELYETVSYYITKEQKQRIKLAALQQDKEISQLVREILLEYFDRQ